MPGKRILLIGAGHAHLHVIARATRLTARGHAVTVVAPGPFWYSGMATGMVGGAYASAEDQIDAAALARARGAEFIAGSLAGLDRAARFVRLADGQTVPYDALSLNIGSVVPAIPGGDGPGCYSAKPIDRLETMRADLGRRFRAGTPTRVVVAGGGPTAAELAANIAALATRCGGAVDLTIVAGDGGFLAQLPSGAAEGAIQLLRRRGVTIREGRVERLGEGRAVLGGGEVLPFDLFLNATGLRAPPLLGELGLPLSGEGGLLVDRHLRSVADPAIHAAGDCSALTGHALPKVGVYSVREGPVLLANLIAAAEGSAPAAFRPQRRYLWIMNLGEGTALAIRGRLWWRGRSAFLLKDWIDRRFMARYRRLARRP